MGIVYPYGSKEVDVSSKIAIFTEGAAKVYYYYNLTNLAPTFEYSSSVSNQEVVLTPGSSVGKVRIDAGAEKVYYETGAAPVISRNLPDYVGSTDPLLLTGLAASGTGGNGGDAKLVGSVANDGSSTTAGGVGGDSLLVAGDGGDKADTGAAAGGAGGAGGITAGDGGNTASSGSDAGGAGGDISITAGTGGNASAGTGDGGAGGSVVITPGSGGTSSGGSAGVAGVIIERGNKLVKQGAPSAKTTNATLTAAEVLTGIITVNQGAAGTSAQQLPLATAMDTALPDSAAGDAFDFSVINISTTDAEDATVTTNTGWTLVGNMGVQANNAVTEQSSGRFRARKTGAGAWTLYRIA